MIREASSSSPPSDVITLSEPPPEPFDGQSVPLIEGTRIGESYRVVRSLGTGGMGQVVLAYDEMLDRRVAIKVIRPELARCTRTRAAFVAEARAMARLVHPNVVGVRAIGELEGAPYLVMDYVPGRSLEALLRGRNGPLSLDEAAVVLDQIGRGLAALHAAGLVHRDLKPANVLVGPGYRVALGDLGIARRVGDEPAGQPTAVSGTPSYMAPEVRLGVSASPELAPRADVFSLGVMAYQIITGQLPYTNDKLGGFYKPVRASDLRPGLPFGVDEVIEQALELHPERRIHSADAFRRALLAALQGRPHPGDGPERILVVDDDPSYRNLLSVMLARAFPIARIEAAPDGRAALHAARRAWPELVVTDLDMPGMDGAALTSQLRELPDGDTLPIVVCSAIAGPTDWRLLSELGADGYLVKPFEDAQLITLARAAMDARAAELKAFTQRGSLRESCDGQAPRTPR